MKLSISILGIKNNELLDIINNSQADYIHLDVMDGKFVNNKNLTPRELTAIIKQCKKPLDIHIMANQLKEYIYNIDLNNIEYITFHYESINQISSSIKYIKEKNIKCGIAIKPSTPINILKPYLEEIDLILIMSVEPGFSGQTFLTNTYNRIKEVKKMIANKKIVIEIDGGINSNNIKQISENGADIVVVGSYITNSNNINETIKTLKEIIS
ncbi:MAG: ribulose-phosphate 3-epimerase [bacterium]|nr:ribulose-phosphate 3-epimerase [bacterium]